MGQAATPKTKATFPAHSLFPGCGYDTKLAPGVAHSLERAIRIEKREATRMLRLLALGFRRRRAVSTIIGGLIILSLILTALGTMIAVSQQYDQYQQTINKMGQYESQQFSEKLVINSPGLSIITSTVFPVGEAVARPHTIATI